MIFKVWKVEHGCPPDHSWCTYSLCQGPETPVVLHDKQFEALFPGIDLAAIPPAPGTAVIEIEAKLK